MAKRKPCRRSGKHKFPSHEAAMVRAARILSKPTSRATFLRSYRCPFCDQWHLTSQELKQSTPV